MLISMYFVDVSDTVSWLHARVMTRGWAVPSCDALLTLTVACGSTATYDPWNGAVAAGRLRSELR